MSVTEVRRAITAEGGALAVLDLDLSAKNSEQLGVHGLPPMWRFLAGRLAAGDLSLHFVNPALQGVDGVVEELANGHFGALVLHLDNFLPGFVDEIVAGAKGRSDGLLVLACGYLPTVKPTDVLERLPDLDGLLRGPLEAVIPALAELATGEIELAEIRNFVPRKGGAPRPYEPPRLSLDGLGARCREAPPSTLGAGLQARVGILQASSGCPCRCSFCRASAFYRGYSRNPYSLRPCEDVVQEIEHLARTAGVRHFKFYDNNFLGTPKLAPRRARELAEGIERLGLAITFELHCRTETVTAEVLDLLCPVGLRHLALGFESMDPVQLARYEKGERVEDHRRAASLIAERGLMAQGYTILADPLATRQELVRSLAGLRELAGRILVLIHERMILYEDTPYYRLHRGRLRRAHKLSRSLGTVVDYEFADPWLRQHFPLLEQASKRFKATLVDHQRRRSAGPTDARSLHRFVRAGTELRLELLERIVADDEPDAERVAAWHLEAERRIQARLLDVPEPAMSSKERRPWDRPAF